MDKIKTTLYVGAYTFSSNACFLDSQKEYKEKYGDKGYAAVDVWDIHNNLKTSEMLKALNLPIGAKVTVLVGGNSMRKYTGTISSIKYGDRSRYEKYGAVSHDCRAILALQQENRIRYIMSPVIEDITILN